MSNPNVVMIVLDDATKLDLQIMTGGFFPNIQAKISTPGVKFDNAFSTCSLCAPSRATLLTGKYPHNHGVLGNTSPEGGVGNFNDTDTFATRLQGGGYHTMHVGKYLNGYGELPQADTYVPPGWSDWNGLIQATYSVFDYKVNKNGVVSTYGHALSDYQTAVLGDLASTAVTSGLGSGKPLFLQVAPMAPHIEDSTIAPTLVDGYQEGDDPWKWWARPDSRDQTGKAAFWNYISNTLPFYPSLAASFNEGDVSDKPSFLRPPSMDATDIAWATFQYRTRLLCLLPVDDIVAKIATALGPTQLANTVWILLSDNGFMLGEHRKSQKLAAYEPSIRVPLYISGPGVIARTESNIAINNDIYPTIIELAGLPPNLSADGRSLVPSLGGSSPTGRKRFLVTHTEHSPLTPPDLPSFSGVRTGPLDIYPQRMYIEYNTGDKELYDLPVDQYELTNVASSPGKVTEVAALAVELAALKVAAGSAACAIAEG